MKPGRRRAAAGPRPFRRREGEVPPSAAGVLRRWSGSRGRRPACRGRATRGRRPRPSLRPRGWRGSARRAPPGLSPIAVSSPRRCSLPMRRMIDPSSVMITGSWVKIAVGVLGQLRLVVEHFAAGLAKGGDEGIVFGLCLFEFGLRNVVPDAPGRRCRRPRRVGGRGLVSRARPCSGNRMIFTSVLPRPRAGSGSRASS